MTRLHLKYHNIDRRVLDATETLFSQAPWRADENPVVERIGQEWLDTVSGIYGVSTPVLSIDKNEPWAYPFILRPGEMTEDVDGIPNSILSPTIVMVKWSITNLFGAFRAYCLAHGAVEVRAGSPGPNSDVWEWATSLFYAVKPVMFRARCREGRIFVVDARDTFNANTLETLGDAGLLDELEAFGASREWRLKVDAYLRGEAVGEDVESASPSEALETPVEAPNTGVDPVPTGDYNDLDTTALRRLASERNVPRAYRNTKAENVAALREQDRQHTQERFENDVPADDQAGI